MVKGALTVSTPLVLASLNRFDASRIDVRNCRTWLLLTDPPPLLPLKFTAEAQEGVHPRDMRAGGGKE